MKRPKGRERPYEFLFVRDFAGVPSDAGSVASFFPDESEWWPVANTSGDLIGYGTAKFGSEFFVPVQSVLYVTRKAGPA